MQLNHLNLCFADVQSARRFFETYFGFHVIGTNNDTISVLSDADDFVLVLSNFEKTTEYRYPPSFHIGFILDSVAEVKAVHRRMEDDGLAVGEPKNTPRGTTFYGHIQESVMFEVLSRPEPK